MNKVTPTYAKLQTKQTSTAARLTIQQAQILRIKNEIRSQHIKKDKINKRLLTNHLELVSLIGTDNFLGYYNHIKTDIDAHMTIKYDKLRKKLDKLTEKNHTNITTRFHTRTVNLTDIKLTEEETKLLDKGLKHNLNNINPDKDIEQLTIDTELAINKLPTDLQTHARHTITDILQKVHKNMKHKNINIKTNNTEHRILKQLKNKIKDNELTITKADKGNATVIIKTKDYVTKTLDFINKNGYQQLNKDPTNKYQQEIKNVINRSPLIIPLNSKFRYINPNPSTPPLKALPKIHKPNIPIRPIVNYRPAPAYKLTQLLAKTVKELADLEDKHTLKNSHELTTLTSNLTLTENSRLISLDVTNLYTTIPVKETLDTLEERLLLNHDKQTVKQLLDLLRTTLRQNFFKFNGSTYLATDGLGMGHPTSSVMSEVFLQSLEDIFVPQIAERFGVTFYKRYVDDCFLVIESDKDTTNDLLTYMNGLHTNINFTIEKETNGQLNYMDLKITRSHDKLKYGIHRKATATNHTIHATSNHPTEHKLSAYRSMLHRLNNIPLTTNEHTKEINTIYEIASSNGYNRRTINKLRQQYNTRTDKSTDDTVSWTTLTYVGKETYRLTNFFKQHNIMTAFRTNNNLGNKLKQKQIDSNIYDNSGIYKLTCNDCDEIYIGKTGRNLRTRYKEHIRSYIYNRVDSNYANHLRTNGHEPKPIEDSMTLLHREPKGPKLDVLERLEIYKHRTDNKTLINEQLLTNSDVTFSVLRQINRNKRKRENEPQTHNKRLKH